MVYFLIKMNKILANLGIQVFPPNKLADRQEFRNFLIPTILESLKISLKFKVPTRLPGSSGRK
jgi:hypothetical protein